jgi:hypothetical protein
MHCQSVFYKSQPSCHWKLRAVTHSFVFLGINSCRSSFFHCMVILLSRHFSWQSFREVSVLLFVSFPFSSPFRYLTLYLFSIRFLEETNQKKEKRLFSRKRRTRLKSRVITIAYIIGYFLISISFSSVQCFVVSLLWFNAYDSKKRRQTRENDVVLETRQEGRRTHAKRVFKTSSHPNTERTPTQDMRKSNTILYLNR